MQKYSKLAINSLVLFGLYLISVICELAILLNKYKPLKMFMEGQTVDFSPVSLIFTSQILVWFMLLATIFVSVLAMIKIMKEHGPGMWMPMAALAGTLIVMVADYAVSNLIKIIFAL